MDGCTSILTDIEHMHVAFMCLGMQRVLPARGCFGYHVTSFFAPASRQGTPEELPGLGLACLRPYPEGPSTQYLRTLVPKTIPLMAFGTRVLKYWVLGPSGTLTEGYQKPWFRESPFSWALEPDCRIRMFMCFLGPYFSLFQKGVWAEGGRMTIVADSKTLFEFRGILLESRRRSGCVFCGASSCQSHGDFLTNVCVCRCA